jgi:hypothetical protein
LNRKLETAQIPSMTGFKTGNSPNFIQSNFGRSLLQRLDSHGLDFAELPEEGR